MFLIVRINYFFPHTETVTSEVTGKLLRSHSKPTMRTWLRVHHQVSPQERVTQQAGAASCAMLARQIHHGSWAITTTVGCARMPGWRCRCKRLCSCVSSPTHPASRSGTSGSTGRHAGRDSLVSPSSQWIWPDNVTELQPSGLRFSSGGRNTALALTWLTVIYSEKKVVILNPNSSNFSCFFKDIHL